LVVVNCDFHIPTSPIKPLMLRAEKQVPSVNVPSPNIDKPVPVEVIDDPPVVIVPSIFRVDTPLIATACRECRVLSLAVALIVVPPLVIKAVLAAFMYRTVAAAPVVKMSFSWEVAPFRSETETYVIGGAVLVVVVLIRHVLFPADPDMHGRPFRQTGRNCGWFAAVVWVWCCAFPLSSNASDTKSATANVVVTDTETVCAALSVHVPVPAVNVPHETTKAGCVNPLPEIGSLA
jgi:hypothetical protein